MVISNDCNGVLREATDTPQADGEQAASRGGQ